MTRMIQMVGPLSSEEIEDVVSSVRRLVSNEQRPRTLSRDLNAGRLLLTPALRVVADTSPLSPLILETPLTAQVQTPAVEPATVADAVDSIPEVEAPMVLEAEWEEEIWTTPQPTLAEVALGAEEAEVLPAPRDVVESDELIGAFAAEPEASPAPWAQVETEWEDDEPVTFVPLRRRAENLAARIAAAQSEGVTPTQEVEDRDAASSESAPLADDPHEAWPDPEEALADEMDEDDPELPTDREDRDVHRMATELLDADGTPIAVLDEAALQDIVRQMIREELQGVLGERITRNVRKLVRAEINRALVARDLD